ncbi:hypothetical protein ACQ4PT_016757 [Festuca glaucescens]
MTTSLSHAIQTRLRPSSNLSSWQEGTNCCLWEGVDCGGSSGRVTALNLNGRSFSSSGLDPVIFNLSSLQFLDLSMNDFGRYSMPAIGFERLTFLAHLNLSNSNFHGEIPIAIGKLENLISLDLSSHYGTFSDDRTIESTYFPNSLSVSNIQAIVGNLSNLRALYLDFVKIHSTGEEWCEALAKYVPRLQVLSFEQCGLSGPIHQSLSNLSSLIVINLQHNNGISAGPFPEFFTYFVNLSVLQVAGEILTSIFILPALNSLALFDNQLSGPLQEFNVVSLSLVYLELGMNKLTGQIPRSIYELVGLRRLNIVSNNFTGLVDLTLFLRLTKLSHLGLSNNKLSVMDGEGNNSFSTYPSELAWLELVGCNITKFPSMLIHLNNLSYLDLSSNKLSGDIPNWI